MLLDDKLNFGEHLKYIADKVNKSIELLCKLQNLLPRRSLVTIYKSFIRPHIDYRDVIFDQTYNKSFHEKLENFQYNASLPITGEIRGTSKENLYQELGFESLQHRSWFRKLCTFYKIFKINLPVIFMSYYLSKPLLTTQRRLSMYHFFILDTVFSKIRFFLLQ